MQCTWRSEGVREGGRGGGGGERESGPLCRHLHDTETARGGRSKCADAGRGRWITKGGRSLGEKVYGQQN